MRAIRDAWRRWSATRYSRLVESENARLRAENRALLNSILGIAGVPPIAVVAPDSTASEQEQTCTDALRPRSGRKGVSATGLGVGSALGTGTSQGNAHLAMPVRRRSWHQVNRALEIDSARKKEQLSASSPE